MTVTSLWKVIGFGQSLWVKVFGSKSLTLPLPSTSNVLTKL